jgi:hypothetical protein
MFALNFYSTVFAEQLRQGRKTATIRLGDKREKYREGEVVWVTVGRRFGERQKVFAAVIDRAEYKQIRDLSPREIERDNPEIRRGDALVEFLSQIYGRPVTADDWVTIVQFSAIRE